MRFFQSESHSKPDDQNNDNDDTVRPEPVPAPRVSEENDADRGPDAADSPHISTGRAEAGTDDQPHLPGGRADSDADADSAADADRHGTTADVSDRPHISIGREDPDGSGDADDESPRPADGDSSTRDGGPVDADVVSDDPVFVEPAPQETAFGAATVGGAVAASEAAARRSEETAADHDGVSDGDRADADDAGKPLRAETVEGFGTAGPDTVTPVRADDTEGFGSADPVDEDGKPIRAESVEGFGAAGRDTVTPVRADDTEGFGTADPDTVTPVRAGDAEGFKPVDRVDEDGEPIPAESVEGFGPAGSEGFGAAGPVGTDESNRAEDAVEADSSAEGHIDDDKVTDRAAEDEPGHSHAAETAALGVAAGAAAGAVAAGAVAKKDRDRDGHPDSERVAPDGAPLASEASAAVPIEPIPAPADAVETPVTTDEPVELLPGDVPEQPALAAFFTEAKATDFRDRWREVQLRFVDDPAQAASDAGTLIDEVVTALNAAITAQREALGGTTSGAGDTEQLRVLVRRQRDFLDRILGL